jgi:hypothetical protein
VPAQADTFILIGVFTKPDDRQGPSAGLATTEDMQRLFESFQPASAAAAEPHPPRSAAGP